MRPPASLLELRARIGRTPRAVAGMGLMALSTLLLTTMQATIRLVPGELHPFEMAFIRNAIGLLLLGGFFLRSGTGVLRTRRLPLHAVRGVFNVLSMFAFFYGLPRTPLAMVSALGFTAPLFASLLAIPLLGERTHPHRLAVIGIGVIGTLLILRPGVAEVTLGPVLILMSAVTWSGALVVIKLLSRTESTGTITLYMAMFMTPLSFIGAAPFWTWPSPEQVGWLALVACLGSLGHLSLAQAFRMADATAVLPLDFLKLVWGSLLGLLLFAEVPDVMTWVGGTVIFFSTFYLAMRESR